MVNPRLQPRAINTRLYWALALTDETFNYKKGIN